MSGILKPTHILPKMQALNLKLRVSIKMKEHNLNFYKLSQRMGLPGNYLYKKLSKKDADMSVLLALSQHLQTNLLEPYVNLLPEPLRTTEREKELQQQLATQQQQITALERERDLYKAIAMK